MSEILKIRNKVIMLYKRNEILTETALRIIGGFVVFFLAASFMPGGALSFKKLITALFGGLISAVASPIVFLMLLAAVASVAAALASVEAGIIVFTFCVLAFLFYGRIFPKESLLFAAMLALYKIGVPYVIPVAAGLYVGPAAIMPVCAAIFVHSYGHILYEIIGLYPTENFTAGGAMDTFMETAKIVYEGVSASYGWIILCFAAALAMLVSWALSTSFAKWEKEKAIALSGIILIAGGIVSTAASEIYLGRLGIIGMIISVLVSCAAAYVAVVFDCVKDYSRTERVVFQDSNYVYYVRAVPKISGEDANIKEETRGVSRTRRLKPKKAVKKRSAGRENEENEG